MVQTGGGLSPLFGATRNLFELRTSALSAFGSADYRVTDRFAVTAGLRYTSETKRPTYDRISSGIFALPTQQPTIPRVTLPSDTENNLDGNVGVKFNPDSRTMIYATYSRGSKSGGFQNNPTTIAVASYKGEVAYTAEAGIKYDLPGAGYLTAAIFDMRVDDFQVSRAMVVNGLVQTVVANADIGSRGFEGSGVVSVGRGVTLNGSVVYSPAKFRHDFPEGAPVLIGYRNMPLPRAPRWTGEAGARYRGALSDRLDLRLEGAVRYTGDADQQFRSTDPLAPASRASTLLDAQIAVGDKRDGWEIAVIGTNLTDRRFVTFSSALSASGGAYYGTLNRPRIVAVQLRIFR